MLIHNGGWLNTIEKTGNYRKESWCLRRLAGWLVADGRMADGWPGDADDALGPCEARGPS